MKHPIHDVAITSSVSVKTKELNCTNLSKDEGLCGVEQAAAASQPMDIGPRVHKLPGRVLYGQFNLLK